MSCACTIVSPSIASVGRGGLVVLVRTERNLAMVSAGVAPNCSASRMATCLSKSNRQRITPASQRTELRLAPAVRCASTSRTVKPAHSYGVAHCSPVRPARSAARAVRSAWISGQMPSAVAVGCLRFRFGHLSRSPVVWPGWSRSVGGRTPAVRQDRRLPVKLPLGRPVDAPPRLRLGPADPGAWLSYRAKFLSLQQSRAPAEAGCRAGLS